jgi:hypothetical protein
LLKKTAKTITDNSGWLFSILGGETTMRGGVPPAKAFGRRGSFSQLAILVALICVGSGLGGCTAMTGSLFPSLGFSGSDADASPDCGEIEQRIDSAKIRYAAVLGKEKPAVYLTFAGNLSKSMKSNRLKGVQEMTDLQLDEVVSETEGICLSRKLPRNICEGAERLGEAYRPLVVAARDAYANYCGDRPIR